jgi:hypothetical protein
MLCHMRDELRHFHKLAAAAQADDRQERRALGLSGPYDNIIMDSVYV